MEKEIFPTFGEVNIKRVVDWRTDYEKKIRTITPTTEYLLYLNHSCNEWEIGNVEEALSMAANLMAAAKYCKENPLTPRPPIIKPF